MAQHVSFKRDILDEAVRAMLDRYLNLPIGLSDTPKTGSTPLTAPFVVVFQSPSKTAEGGWAYPQDEPYFSYLIKSAGRDHRETARTASRVDEAMIGRSTYTGLYLAELLNAGCDVIERASGTKGAIVSSGPDLFEVGDIYDLKVAL